MIKKSITVALTAACMLIISPAFADRANYQRLKDLKIQSVVLSIEHHHDWSNQTHMSSLRVVDRTTGTILFNKPVPALTYLWISPDSNFIVGLSNIRYFNQYQLIVLSRTGSEILKKDLTSLDWAQSTFTASNWIYWYKEPDPKIVIDQMLHTLKVEDSHGVMQVFQL